MIYVCIEDGIVISCLGYEPEVPPSVSVVQITMSDYQLMIDGTHMFDVATSQVVPVPDSVTAEKQKQERNSANRRFLDDTDWKVLRHLREQALGITPSLSPAEFLALEQSRADAAAAIT